MQRQLHLPRRLLGNGDCHMAKTINGVRQPSNAKFERQNSTLCKLHDKPSNIHRTMFGDDARSLKPNDTNPKIHHSL
jgi:hypothetical protein